jgi:paraquat-inducible protein B
VEQSKVMSDSSRSIDVESLPPAISHEHKRSRLPLVWIVPLIAAIIGGWIAVRAIVERGPRITVTFIDADGIEAGKTKVRYKSVDVGLVRQVALASDLRTVRVTMEMAKFAEPLLVTDTRFWVVRPRLGSSGVSGLGTLLSGAYISLDKGGEKTIAREYAGLESPAVVAGGAAGRQFVLESRDLGSLNVGAPAYFHNIQVGQISSLSLDPDGQGVTLKLFVAAPYDRFVTDDSRFWHASGVDVAVDSAGLRVQTQSLTSILAGGIAFDSPIGSNIDSPAPGDTHFRLAANRDSAMKAPDRVVETYILYFEESVRGLAPGATVDFRGVDIGEVTSLKVDYDRTSERFLFPVLINVYPERIRSRYRAGSARPQAEAHALVGRMIEHGFRAQLRTGSLLTGQLYIALDFFPHTDKVKPQPELSPMPLPTIPGNLQMLQNTVVRVARKLDQVPLAEIGNNLNAALTSLNKTLGGATGVLGKVDAEILPEAKSTLEQARSTLSQTRQMLAPEASLQGDLHSTLLSIGRAADSVKLLAEYLDEHPEALLRGKAQDPK